VFMAALPRHPTTPADRALCLRGCPRGGTTFMLAPFFVLAAVSPSRQFAFRRLVAVHLALLAGLALAAAGLGKGSNFTFIGYTLLTAGIVEGALLVGWRLTQL